MKAITYLITFAVVTLCLIALVSFAGCAKSVECSANVAPLRLVAAGGYVEIYSTTVNGHEYLICVRGSGGIAICPATP